MTSIGRNFFIYYVMLILVEKKGMLKLFKIKGGIPKFRLI
jgi:hypothetical protein